MSTLYKNLLGAKFLQLSPLLQRFHTEQAQPWQGEAAVSWSKNPLIRLCLKLGGLPREGSQQPVTVFVTGNTSHEIWHRTFGGQRMLSKQKLSGQSLYEYFGPVSLALDNRVQQGALHQSSPRSRLFGLPLPHLLGFQITAREWQEDERFNFDVEIGLANLSLIRYIGWLTPQNREA